MVMASNLYQLFPVIGGDQLIRVLDIEADTSTSAELRASLRVVSLRDSPRFTALSYVWGNKTDQDPTLRCSGHYISVTMNCYEALKSLRDLYGNLTVWVDAICIRQTDEAEKSSQILLMEDIYSWAEVVYVWIGNGTPQTDRAMNCIRSIRKHIRCLEHIGIVSAPTVRERMKCAAYWVKDLFWIYSSPMFFLTGSGEYSSRNFVYFATDEVARPRYQTYDNQCHTEDFQELLSREWADRIWTFQEIILACNAVFVCGTKAVSWDDLIRAINFTGSVNPIQHNNWQSIARLWMNLERKSCWNHRRVRRPLPTRRLISNREPGERHLVGSFLRYQDLVKRRTKLLLSSVHSLMMLLPFAICITIIALLSNGLWPFRSLYGTMPDGTINKKANPVNEFL
jgi:hypothetical protein